jgi:hypothetical protein
MDSHKAENPQAKPELADSDWDDLDKLTVSQSFGEMAGVKKALVTVPVRRPNKQTFFRVHPSLEYRKDFHCLEMEEENRELFIVHPSFVHEIDENLLTQRTFYLAVTRQGIPFLWPIKLPRPDGRKNEWAISERLAAEQGVKRWTRMWSNMRLGAYEHCFAEGENVDPVFPDLSFSEIFKVAFKSSPLIRSHDHAAMKLLRGE